MPNDTIRALIFDYGGVLMRTVDPRPRRDLERRLELEPGDVYHLVFHSPRWGEVQQGQIDSETFWAHVAQGLSLDEGQLARFRRAFWAGDRLDEDLVNLIRDLRQEGYRTALLSNAPSDMRAFLEELEIDDAFDVIVISGEEGVVKPSPQIYHRTLDRLGVAPREAVFVDDMQVNVDAAAEIGLHSTRFRGLAPLKVWLEDLGVSVPDPTPDPVAEVEAVIFDWGGVMEELPSDTDVARWEGRLAVASGVLPEVLWGEAWRRLEIGAISDEEYVELVARRLDLPDKSAALHFLQRFYTTDRLNHEVLDATRALRDRYRVGLLSNAFPSQAEVVQRYHGIDLEGEFDVYVNSALVGVSKPNPDIYRLALQRLGVEPQRAIFLDDNLRNVDAACALGVHAIQFVNPRVSLSRLEELLGHPILS